LDSTELEDEVSGQRVSKHPPQGKIEVGSGARGGSALASGSKKTASRGSPVAAAIALAGTLAALAAVAAGAERKIGRRGTDRGVAKNVVALFFLPLAYCST
jgi:hypothetical protein